jgi:hypothetical protein
MAPKSKSKAIAQMMEDSDSSGNDALLASPMPKAKTKSKAKAVPKPTAKDKQTGKYDPLIPIKIAPRSKWLRPIPEAYVKEKKGSLSSIKNMNVDDIMALMDLEGLEYDPKDKKDKLAPILREHLLGLISSSSGVALATSDEDEMPDNIIVVKLVRFGVQKGTKAWNDAVIRSHFCLDWTVAEAKAFVTEAFKRTGWMARTFVTVFEVEGCKLHDTTNLRATCIKNNCTIRYSARNPTAEDPEPMPKHMFACFLLVARSSDPDDRAAPLQEMTDGNMQITCVMMCYDFRVSLTVHPSMSVKKLKHMICEHMVDKRMRLGNLDIRLQFGKLYMNPHDMLSFYGVCHDATVNILREHEDDPKTASASPGVALATPDDFVESDGPEDKPEAETKKKKKKSAKIDSDDEPLKKKIDSDSSEDGHQVKKESRYTTRKLKEKYEQKMAEEEKQQRKKDVEKMTTQELLKEAQLLKNVKDDDEGLVDHDKVKEELERIKLELKKRQKTGALNDGSLEEKRIVELPSSSSGSVAKTKEPQEPLTPKLVKNPWMEEEDDGPNQDVWQGDPKPKDPLKDEEEDEEEEEEEEEDKEEDEEEEVEEDDDEEEKKEESKFVVTRSVDKK